MAWLEIHQSLLTHRKTLEAADQLGIKPVYIVGHVVSLWLWCLDNAPNGRLENISVRIIARAAQWDDDADSFVAAMCSSGLFDRLEDADGYAIHDWWDYAGKLIERREQNTQRMRARRGEHVQELCAERAQHVQDTCDACAPATQQYTTVHNTTEQNKEEKRATRPRQARSVDDKSNGHYSLFAAYCEGLDIKPETIPKTSLPRYLKAAVGIHAAGYTADQVRDCTREQKSGYYRDKSLGLWQIADILPQWKKGGSNGASRQRSSEAESDPSLDRFKAFD